MKKKNRSKTPAWRYIWVIVMAVIFVFPLLVVIVNSVKPLQEIVKTPLSLPQELAFGNYKEAFTAIDYPRVLLNTILLSTVSSAGLVLLASMTSYWCSRHPSRFSKIFETALILSLLIPFPVIMLPLVKVMSFVHVSNSILGGILSFWGIGLAFSSFIMSSAVKAVPVEMEEAAKVDGCNVYQTFFIIVFPTMRATMVSLFLIELFWVWNDLLLPSVLLNDVHLYTLPLAINQFFGVHGSDWNLALAALIMSALPILIVYILLQKAVTEGIVSGAVKG